MARTGRPKGENNFEYIYTVRMDEKTRERLEKYCQQMQKTKSEVIREAIEKLDKEGG